MQAKEGRRRVQSSGRMPATDDEIREKYLERAIRELNQLTREIQECEHCPRGNLMPVLGSGHPQADIFLLKYAPAAAEIEEGVAFYGRAGSALMKSFKRLGIDPLAVYGTLWVKCPVADTDLSAPECRARVLEEHGDRAAADRRRDGRGGARGAERAWASRSPRIEDRPGEIQKLTPSCDALYVPDIDRALDDEGQARLLERLPRARRLVRGLPAVLASRPRGGRFDPTSPEEDPWLRRTCTGGGQSHRGV